MLYVRYVGLFLRSLGTGPLHVDLHISLTSTWQEKINIPHHSDSHCRCLCSRIISTSAFPSHVLDLWLEAQTMTCMWKTGISRIKAEKNVVETQKKPRTPVTHPLDRFAYINPSICLFVNGRKKKSSKIHVQTTFPHMINKGPKCPFVSWGTKWRNHAWMSTTGAKHQLVRQNLKGPLSCGIYRWKNV